MSKEKQAVVSAVADRNAEHDLGWDGEVSRRKQSRSEVRHIQSPLDQKKFS